MNEQVEYEILKSQNSDELTKKVNDMLRLGWRVHGDLSVTLIVSAGSNTRFLYAQVMIKLYRGM